MADMEKKKAEDSGGPTEAPGKAVENEPEAAATPKDPAAAIPKPKDPAPVEEVPDPDEDDLDDLDGQSCTILPIYLLTSFRYA